ncbi:MAG: ATPase [Rhodobacteraceae bacterium]|nr:ATPase [Paracoccaceae bacterium]
MIYNTRKRWLAEREKRVLLFGMSGLGKTYLSNVLRTTGSWFHYSVDYRIGTRYMGEHIVDNFKREAMNNKFLARLLMNDSIYIASNITFKNLEPLSTFLGKPGNVDLGGISIKEYRRRQELHRRAEIASLQDTAHFIERSKDLYRYPNFVCDSGGSICEVINPYDPEDALMSFLARHLLLVWIRGSEERTEQMKRRFNLSPKPMYYRPEFFDSQWSLYLEQHELAPESVDPDHFVRWIFTEAIKQRKPRYEAMYRRWGVVVEASDLDDVSDEESIIDAIGDAIERRGSASA